MSYEIWEDIGSIAKEVEPSHQYPIIFPLLQKAAEWQSSKMV